MARLAKITPCLWFEGNGEEAARFYVSVFDAGRITRITRYTDAGPMPAGTVLTVMLQIEGQEFMILNAPPHDRFNDAVSFVVACASQAEVDRYWAALTADGGRPIACGWLKDRFGVSWQIVPERLFEMIGDDSDPVRSTRTMQAMMAMVKLDLAALEAAWAGSAPRIS